MRAKKDHGEGGRPKAYEPRPAGATVDRSTPQARRGTYDAPRPLFVFNVKVFDDGLLPAALGASSEWPHRYLVVIRHSDGRVSGEGPLTSRLEADRAATRARLALPGAGVHLVVALDESDDALDAFFAGANHVQLVAEEGARARDRYEEWRRKAGPVRPAYVPSAGRYRGFSSPAFG